MANWNPFTHAIELIRFAAYGQFNALSFAVVVGTGLVAFALAVRGYNPLVGALGQVKRD
jgi:ABC-2 type transport system permease protein